MIRKRWVWLEEAESWTLAFTTAGRANGFSARPFSAEAGFCRVGVLEFEAIETAKRMVERKVGVCFRPRITLIEEPYCDRGRFREMAIAVTPRRPTRMAVPHGAAV